MSIVKNCVDCKCKLSVKHKHHFRCNKCWFKHKIKICSEYMDYNIKLKPIRKIR